MSAAARGEQLRRLHDDEPLLVMVNVWDAVSARLVAELPGCRALATASQSIAESHGYRDGEQIPRDLMIDAVARIAAAVELPVSADLEAGYGDVGETVRRAVAAGAVGANIEDQMRPLPEAAAMMAAAVAAADGEGVPFALNARTDAYLRGGDRDGGELMEEAIARGRAFLDAGATCVFVPGRLEAAEIEALVAGIGVRKLSVLAGPGFPSGSELEAMGVARISFGPWTQRLALTALLDAGADLLAGGSLPDWVRPVA
jgi:2-methylisocitrate lyase-like PEP mutase family enzyme